ncbi:MAG TPA: FAD-dependent oxidoreductase [Acidimicrobiales bacterium]|nr:FAD-dependent oxidoreductase [Acidimicrobiales bacterium]
MEPGARRAHVAAQPRDAPAFQEGGGATARAAGRGRARVSDQGASVIVVGGGLAGLSAAFELSERDVEVLLIEAGDVVGGRTASWTEDGMPVESGLHRFLGFSRRCRACWSAPAWTWARWCAGRTSSRSACPTAARRGSWACPRSTSPCGPSAASWPTTTSSARGTSSR